MCRHIFSKNSDFFVPFLHSSTCSEWSGSCQLSMQLLHGGLKSCLFVLHLFPHRLVGLILLTVTFWGQCKTPVFLAQMFALFPAQQKRSICSLGCKGLSSPSVSQTLRSRRSRCGLCSANTALARALLPTGPAGGAVCARLCPAAAVCGEGQEAVLAWRNRCAHCCPLRGLLLLLPPYGAVGKDVSHADPSFTPQLFLSVHLNSKRSAEKREDAALCLWSTGLAAFGFARILWYHSKRILRREATLVINHCAWGCWRRKQGQKGSTLPCLLFSGWLRLWDESCGLHRAVSPLNHPILRAGSCPLRTPAGTLAQTAHGVLTAAPATSKQAFLLFRTCLLKKIWALE